MAATSVRRWLAGLLVSAARVGYIDGQLRAASSSNRTVPPHFALSDPSGVQHAPAISSKCRRIRRINLESGVLNCNGLLYCFQHNVQNYANIVLVFIIYSVNYSAKLVKIHCFHWYRFSLLLEGPILRNFSGCTIFRGPPLPSLPLPLGVGALGVGPLESS